MSVVTLTAMEFAKRIAHYLEAMRKARKMEVAVGLTESTEAVYEDGASVLEVGAAHEFGNPEQGLPTRSFLRLPFQVKRDEMNKVIDDEWAAVLDKGQGVKMGLERMGVEARNIVLEAFDTGGFGEWEDISDETKDAKAPKTGILKDTGVLGGSQTWEVRDA